MHSRSFHEDTVAIFLVKEDEFHFYKHIARKKIFKKCIFLFTAPFEVLPGYQTIDLCSEEFITVSARDLFNCEAIDSVRSYDIKNSHLLGEQRYLRPYHKRFYWDVNIPSPELQIELSLETSRKAYDLAQQYSEKIIILTLGIANLFSSSALNYFNDLRLDIVYLVHSHFKNYHIPYTNNINHNYDIAYEISPLHCIGINWYPIKPLANYPNQHGHQSNFLDDGFSQRTALSVAYKIMFGLSFKRFAQLVYSYYVSLLQYSWSQFIAPSKCKDKRLLKYFKQYTSLARPLNRILTSVNDIRTRTIIHFCSSSKKIEIPEGIDYVCILLHMFPEASLIGELNGYADEREWIFSIWKSLPISTHLYVFEHPAMSWSGERPFDFYKFISKFHNTHVIHTQKYKGVPASVIESAKHIYSFAGSIALEAAAKGLSSTTVTTRPYSYVDNIKVYDAHDLLDTNHIKIKPSDYFKACSLYPDFDLDTIKWDHMSINLDSLDANLERLLLYL